MLYGLFKNSDKRVPLKCHALEAKICATSAKLQLDQSRLNWTENEADSKIQGTCNIQLHLWYDPLSFCNWLSAKLQADGVNITLFHINSNPGKFQVNSVIIRLQNLQLQEWIAEGVKSTQHAFYIKPSKFESMVLI